MLARLQHLFTCADACGLKVILRIGFLWENANVRQRTYSRFANTPTSKRHKKAWKEYCRLLSNFSAQQKNFAFAFISWEDYFWPVFRRIVDMEEGSRDLELKDIGYYNYLSAVGLQPEEELIDPPNERKFFFEIWKFARFFDTRLLEELHNLATDGFSGLEYEGRPDVNPFVTSRGVRSYSWTLTRLPYARPITYFHPNMFSKKRETISKDVALKRLSLLLSQYEVLNDSESKVFIDQFNFVTKNPEFDHFNKIDDNDLCSFVLESASLLMEKSSGYGIWGYRDWTNDKIFNGAFEFENDGWEAKACDFLVGHGCNLTSGSLIQQKIYQSLARNAVSYLEYDCLDDAKLEICIDSAETKVIHIKKGTGKKEIFFKGPAKSSISLLCIDGRVTLKKFSIFDHIFSSGMYYRNFTERPAVSAIRTMNALLENQ